MGDMQANTWVEPLAAREIEILGLISKGLSNREIAQKLFLTIGTIKWYNKQIFRKLGVNNRMQAVNLAVEQGLLKQEIDQQERSNIPSSNLPSQLTSFVGRVEEIEKIKQLLKSHRLVVLTGPGGSGKTRLALQVVAELSDHYRDGAWLVELAPLNDPDLVADAIIQSLKAQIGGDAAPGETLKRYLARKHILLLLDNFEHLLAASPLVAELLAAAPQLTVLATSRERLHLYGEQEYPVRPLQLPDIEHPESIAELLSYEAINLFVQRAQLVQPDFKLTLENAASVAQICSQLDGIPLAIELAAARVNIFSTTQIAMRLEDCFDLLIGGSRTTLPHHRTIRASIDWSWNLTSDSERTLLRRLTVFAGGWTLEAAEAVCSTAGVEPRQVLELMTQLVAKSLVIPSGKPGRVRRFNLHETIRQYAHEKLVEAGEDEDIPNRHLKYFLEHSVQIESGLYGPQYMEWLAEANEERDNIRVALEHACEVDVEAGLYISGRLQEYWNNLDQRVGEFWLTEFIQKPEAQDYPHARARALLALGWILLCLQQFSRMRSVGQECLALYRLCGDQHGEADALLLFGNALQLLDERESAIELFEQSLELSQSLDDARRQAGALLFMGYDRPAVMLGYWEEAIDLYRQAGDLNSLASLLYQTARCHILLTGDIEKPQQYIDEAERLSSLKSMNNRGLLGHYAGWAKSTLALMRGDYEEAYAHLQEVAAFTQESGDRLSYLWTRVSMGTVALHAGDLVEACQIFTTTAQIFRKNGNTTFVVFALEGLLRVYAAGGKPELAARLIGWTDATRVKIINPRLFLEQANIDKDIATIIAMIGASAYQAAYESGQDMTLDEAVALAKDNHVRV
jgi:predicted ATPase/DNA-binding CsgD family transcriptional regulator